MDLPVTNTACEFNKVELQETETIYLAETSSLEECEEVCDKEDVVKIEFVDTNCESNTPSEKTSEVFESIQLKSLEPPEALVSLPFYMSLDLFWQIVKPLSNIVLSDENICKGGNKSEDLINILEDQSLRDKWICLRDSVLEKIEILTSHDDQHKFDLTVHEWLVFDLILVHQSYDIIGMSDTTQVDKKIYVDLFELVKEFHIESLQGDDLAEAWSAVTMAYNTGGRQSTPMLLQCRWYQLKLATKTRYLKYWAFSKREPEATYMADFCIPSPLQMAIGRRYRSMIAIPFVPWKDLVKQKKVILREQFQFIALRKRAQGPENNTNGSKLKIVLGKPIYQPIYQAPNQPIDAAIKQAINQAMKKAINQSNKQPINQAIKQSHKQPINQPFYQPIYQPINLPINQVINLPVNQQINLPINQPVCQPTYNTGLLRPVTNVFGNVYLTDLPKTRNIDMATSYDTNIGVGTIVNKETAVNKINNSNINNKKSVFDLTSHKNITHVNNIPQNKNNTVKNIRKTAVNKLSNNRANLINKEAIFVDMANTCIDIGRVIDKVSHKPLENIDNEDPLKLSDEKDDWSPEIESVMEILTHKNVAKNIEPRNANQQITYEDPVKRLKLSNKLLQKPLNLKYNKSQLRKNPDFNHKLRKLPKHFTKYSYHRKLLGVLTPVTIDVSNEFENALVNGRLYLDTSNGNNEQENDLLIKTRNVTEDNFGLTIKQESKTNFKRRRSWISEEGHINCAVTNVDTHNIETNSGLSESAALSNDSWFEAGFDICKNENELPNNFAQISEDIDISEVKLEDEHNLNEQIKVRNQINDKEEHFYTDTTIGNETLEGGHINCTLTNQDVDTMKGNSSISESITSSNELFSAVDSGICKRETGLQNEFAQISEDVDSIVKLENQQNPDELTNIQNQITGQEKPFYKDITVGNGTSEVGYINCMLATRDADKIVIIPRISQVSLSSVPLSAINFNVRNQKNKFAQFLKDVKFSDVKLENLNHEIDDLQNLLVNKPSLENKKYDKCTQNEPIEDLLDDSLDIISHIVPDNVPDVNTDIEQAINTSYIRKKKEMDLLNVVRVTDSVNGAKAKLASVCGIVKRGRPKLVRNNSNIKKAMLKIFKKTIKIDSVCGRNETTPKISSVCGRNETTLNISSVSGNMNEDTSKPISVWGNVNEIMPKIVSVCGNVKEGKPKIVRECNLNEATTQMNDPVLDKKTISKDLSILYKRKICGNDNVINNFKTNNVLKVKRKYTVNRTSKVINKSKTSEDSNNSKVNKKSKASFINIIGLDNVLESCITDLSGIKDKIQKKEDKTDNILPEELDTTRNSMNEELLDNKNVIDNVVFANDKVILTNEHTPPLNNTPIDAFSTPLATNSLNLEFSQNNKLNIKENFNKNNKHNVKIKLTSYLFKKPVNCIYNNKNLIKNPDFKEKLRNLPDNFLIGLSNEFNLRPITVDVNKEFEKYLVNGKMYLDTI